MTENYKYYDFEMIQTMDIDLSSIAWLRTVSRNLPYIKLIPVIGCICVEVHLFLIIALIMHTVAL